jgi:long-chain acyl-CoA synthetase
LVTISNKYRVCNRKYFDYELKTKAMIRENLTELIRLGIQKNWNITAMTDYGGISNTYGDVAEKIIKLHLQFQNCGIKPGDKIALVGKNSVNWAVSYLAVITFGAVIVPILPDFKPNDIHHIVNHSDSVLLFVADNIFEGLDQSQMKNIRCIVSLTDFSRTNKKTNARGHSDNESVESTYRKKYPNGLIPSDLVFDPIPNSNLAALSYTSGTTGYTKGVILSHNSLAANVVYANHNMPLEPGDSIVSFLPLAHAYGCAFEFLWPFTLGCHITFLTKTPSPQLILQAFREIKPRLVLSVPLIMEKIYKKQILPVLNKKSIRILLGLPLIDKVLKKKIRNKLIDVFGGNFHEIVIGGAPMSKEVENFLHTIKFPFSIGYGMTECGPLISYANWDKTRLGSAGRIVDSLEIKIDSPDPQRIVGEIMVRGENVMEGYYKNPEATKAVLEPDGWFHTGDLGLIDGENFVYIKGRSKSMILGPSGQNIYPEQIEAMINNLDYVQESLVTEKNGRLVAHIYPDYEMIDKNNVSEKELMDIFENHRKTLNSNIPSYMNISSAHIFTEEFEKTPKKSIKRFLYN